MPWLGALASLVLVSANASAQHVHGLIKLGIVVEGATVAVSLDAPLADVVGFEHAPKTDSQIESVRAAAKLLSSADSMFGFADDGNCSESSVTVDGPAYFSADAEIGHDHDDHHDHNHSHDDDHNHDDHSDHDHSHDADGEQHSEVRASYEWTCGAVASVDAIELRFIDGFADVESIEVQILTANGARVVTVGGDARQIAIED